MGEGQPLVKATLLASLRSQELGISCSYWVPSHSPQLLLPSHLLTETSNSANKSSNIANVFHIHTNPFADNKMTVNVNCGTSCVLLHSLPPLQRQGLAVVGHLPKYQDGRQDMCHHAKLSFTYGLLVPGHVQKPICSLPNDLSTLLLSGYLTT